MAEYQYKYIAYAKNRNPTQTRIISVQIYRYTKIETQQIQKIYQYKYIDNTRTQTLHIQELHQYKYIDNTKIEICIYKNYISKSI